MESICWSTMLVGSSAGYTLLQSILISMDYQGIARDDSTKYSNSKPDFKDASAVAEHMWKSDPEKWQETFQTNVTSQFFVAAGFLPLLAKALKNTPGYSPSVVNITSISGVMKTTSQGQFAYASSKAAFIHLTRLLASLFSEAKIRVNSIAPGQFPDQKLMMDVAEIVKASSQAR